MAVIVKYPTIPLSGTLSTIVRMEAGTLFGIWVPTVTSGTMLVQGSWDQTSTNFVRLQNPAGSGDWTFAVGPGSKAITLQDAVFPWPFIRFETSVAQSAVVSLAIPVKIR